MALEGSDSPCCTDGVEYANLEMQTKGSDSGESGLGVIVEKFLTAFPQELPLLYRLISRLLQSTTTHLLHLIMNASAQG